MFKKTNGIFLGRMCPIHIGHEYVINRMIELCGIENCLAFLGSSNAPISIRNLFTAEERRFFFEKIYNIKLIDLPDYFEDNKWMNILDLLIEESNLKKENQIIFFGGCHQDVDFFNAVGKKVYIINRFNGITPLVSGTQIRDKLFSGYPIDNFINPLIVDDIIRTFKQKDLTLL